MQFGNLQITIKISTCKLIWETWSHYMVQLCGGTQKRMSMLPATWSYTVTMDSVTLMLWMQMIHQRWAYTFTSLSRLGMSIYQDYIIIIVNLAMFIDTISLSYSLKKEVLRKTLVTTFVALLTTCQASRNDKYITWQIIVYLRVNILLCINFTLNRAIYDLQGSCNTFYWGIKYISCIIFTYICDLYMHKVLYV